MVNPRPKALEMGPLAIRQVSIRACRPDARFCNEPIGVGVLPELESTEENLSSISIPCPSIGVGGCWMIHRLLLLTSDNKIETYLVSTAESHLRT